MVLGPLPEGLTEEGMIVLAMSVMATIMFITAPIPLRVALLIVLGQIFLWHRLVDCRQNSVE